MLQPKNTWSTYRPALGPGSRRWADAQDFGEGEAVGDDRAVAALLVEDQLTGKRRVIHDATHGARVDHRIKCRDKVRENARAAREAVATGKV